MVWLCHQEAGFACTRCEAWFVGMCKRVRKAKKNFAEWTGLVLLHV